MKDHTGITWDKMSKEERSLLLYLETRVVDYGGAINLLHMNKKDVEIAKSWSEKKFIQFGRIVYDDIRCHTSGVSTHWCTLSESAWKLAHRERRSRAKRMWKNRNWRTTNEKNKEGSTSGVP